MWLHSTGFSAAAVRQLPQVVRITLYHIFQVPTQLAGMQAWPRLQRHSEVQLSHWRLGEQDRQSEGAVQRLPADQCRVPKPFMSMFITQLT
jgi:hypothetical protein